MSETTLSLTIQPELRARFLAAAEAVHRPAEELLRELVEGFLARQQQEREHDAYVRTAIEEGLREANDPSVAKIPHEQVEREWKLQRAALLQRIEAGEN